MTISEIESAINRCAAKGQPFLFAVDYELTKGLFIEEPLNQSKVLFRTPLGTNFTDWSSPNDITATITPHPEPFSDYRKRFDVMMNAFESGTSQVANLTLKTPIETTLGLKEIFCHSNAPFSLYVPGEFVCFSPERFVKIADGIISTNPMKGTISANTPNAEQKILGDQKEIEELNAIVSLMKEELSGVARRVWVERERYIDRLSTSQGTILQVSSEVAGELGADYLLTLGQTLFSIMPAGSISGSPKQSTMEAIKRAEGGNRGYYSGVFGYFDGKELDSAVMIRFIEQEDGQMYFRSGGGLTKQSDPRSEYEEVIEKIYLPF